MNKKIIFQRYKKKTLVQSQKRIKHMHESSSYEAMSLLNLTKLTYSELIELNLNVSFSDLNLS